jgi:hypothetical protein
MVTVTCKNKRRSSIMGYNKMPAGSLEGSESNKNRKNMLQLCKMEIIAVF